MMTGLLVLFTITASATPGLGSAESDQAAIDAQSRRMDEAFESKNLRIWKGILTNDFKAITPRQTFTKAQFIAGGRAEADSALPPISVDIRHTRVDVKGNTAIAQSRERTCYGLNVLHNGVHRFCYRQSFSERWRKEAGTWKLALIRYSPEQELRLDTKVVTREQLRKITSR